MSVITESANLSQDSRTSTSTHSVASINKRKVLSRTVSSQQVMNGTDNRFSMPTKYFVNLCIYQGMMSASDVTSRSSLGNKTAPSELGSLNRLPSLSETRRMNMKDIVIWQKFTRALKQRVSDRRNERRTFCWLDRSTSTRGSRRTAELSIELEPTYRTEPNRKLNVDNCRELIENYLHNRLKNANYESTDCARTSTSISEDIKNLIKAKLLPERYKCVVYTVMGKKCGQGLEFASMCAWNSSHDNQVSASYQNETLFCSVTTFTVYFE